MSEVLLSILQKTAEHTGYTLISVAIGFVLGLSLGIGLSRLPTLAKYLLPLLSILNTVPGIVFIGVLFILIGMTPATVSHFQRLYLVELPLAMPTIIGGLRLSTVYTVSWAVLAAMIGEGGLGDFVYKGVSSNNNELILQGAIPAAVLALTLGALVDLLQRHVVPRGLRKGGVGK